MTNFMNKIWRTWFRRADSTVDVHKITNLISDHKTVSRDKDGTNIEAAVAAAVPARQGVPRWFIGYSLQEAVILDASTKLPDNWALTTIGGRLFDKDRELRWQLNGDEFDLWMLYEAPGKQLLGKTVKYYCLGTWNAARECFGDGRIPRDLPQWVKTDRPLPVIGTKDTDRMFFSVVEYSPTQPESIDTNEDDAARIERITDELNQPRIIAHRIFGVGVDSGENK